MLRALAIFAAVSLVSCSAPVKCDATTCASGCCDSKGQCRSPSPLECGNLGGACVACLPGAQCQLGVCTTAGTGGGTGGGAGGGGGGGAVDAGSDAGTDAGLPDAGLPDAGLPDAGLPDGGRTDGGTDAGLSGFTVTQLDPSAVEATYLAMAVDPAQQRVGVAYFSDRGSPDYDLKYVEWRQGVLSAIQTVRVVQRKVGLSMVFDPITGEPVLSSLGGAADMSAFWFQSDAVLNRRTGGSTWTESIVAARGDQVTCGNPVSDRGFLVGLWPALAVDATGKLYLAYRDGHDGQFPIQDWAGSDVELWEGTGMPSAGSCLAQGGLNKDAWGGHNQLAVCGAELALVHDQMFGSADTNGLNVIFQKRTAAGAWSSPGAVLAVSNTQTGPGLACDAVEGFGVTVVDRATNELVYTNSLTGQNWSTPDFVHGAGSGGWYPSIAMDPVRHEPAIAFYNCSPRSAVNETGCLTTEDELVVSQRQAGTWRQVLVDANGGYAPKLGFFASGKRFVVYRTPPAIDPATGLTVPNAGALQIAIER